MRMRKLIVPLLLFGTAAHAIVIRHDVDDARYRVDESRLPAVGKVLPDGECVLIAPGWVLTAAHIARGAPAERLRVRLAGAVYPVTRIVVHRDWDGKRHDLALMKLARPVEGVPPLPLLERTIEPGAVAVIAGRGDRGNGREGVQGNDGAFRLATNAISEVTSERLVFDMDPPSSATELEGVSGPGDSGTPALIEIDGRPHVAGIGSMGASPDGKRYGEYGSRDIFVRVSAYLDWIEDVVGHP